MTTQRLQVDPATLRWAITRDNRTEDDAARELTWLGAVLAGEKTPTYHQLKEFSAKLHVPFGYLFKTPPASTSEPLPAADFRAGAAYGAAPSPALRDTINRAKYQQDWYAEELAQLREPVEWLGGWRVDDDVAAAAAEAERWLRLAELRWQAQNNDNFRKLLRDRLTECGVTVQINGVVGANTHRKLAVEEFRGFSLSDRYAPLIFVNGADSVAAQNFTMLHELGHLLLGQSAISANSQQVQSEVAAESWCNQFAAHLLLPVDELQKAAIECGVPRLAGEVQIEQLDLLCKRFFVSAIAVFVTLRERGIVVGEPHELLLQEFQQRVRRAKQAGSGGDFYRTLDTRVGVQFRKQVMRALQEGRASYTQAGELLQLSSRVPLYKLEQHTAEAA